MYSTTSGLILAFHGCDEKTRDEVIASPTKSVKPSTNVYDWLGHGAYYWENDPVRALEWAKFLKEKPPKNTKNIINAPSVLGAVIDLGYCFDLLRRENLSILKEFYDNLAKTIEAESLPHNRKIRGSNDALLRDLDCWAINEYHKFREKTGLRPFDSVRGAFWEGNDLYPEAGFKEKSHIQVCIRNTNCVKGYFIPRIEDLGFPAV